MPVVPRTEGPSVAVNPLPSGRMTVRADTQGADALAAGLRQIGGVLGEVAEREQSKADAAALFEARSRLAEWEREQFDPENPKGVAKRRGKDALGLGDDTARAFEEARSRIEQGLQPRQRQAFRQVSGEFGLRFRERVDRYAAQQYEGYLSANEEALLSQSLERAATAGREGRLDAMAAEVEIGHAVIDAQVRRLGLGSDVAELRKAEFTSRGLVATTAGFLEQGDYAGAVKFYRANAEDMIEADRTRMDGTIRNAELELREVEEAASIMATHGTGTSAIRAAERITDPMLRDRVVGRIDAESRRRERAQQQAEAALVARAYDAIAGTDPATPIDQAVPPEVLVSLNPRDRMALHNFQSARLRGEEIQTDPRLYADLSLMPSDKLIEVDLNRLVLERRLHPDHAKRFREQQEAIRNPKDSTFRWSSEADMYRQAELILGVDPSTAKGKRQAGEFRMSADRAIAEREAQLDRSMSREEKWAVMNEQMLRLSRDSSWLGIIPRTEERFAYQVDPDELGEFNVPPSIRTQILADAAAQGYDNLTEAQIREAYVRNAEYYNRAGTR